MGYEIVQELLRAWPPGNAPEWRLLLNLADDADDRTRQTAPGLEFMMERTYATERTVYRWLAKLADDGWIRVVEHSKSAGRNGGKGRRAVYFIPITAMSTDGSRTHLEAGIEARMTCHGGAGDSGSRPDGNHLTPWMSGDCPTRPDYGSNHLTPAVSPPLQDPLRTAPVEGAGLRPDQDRIEEEGPKIKNSHPEREARRALAAQAGP